MVARVSEGETMESPVVSLVLWSSLFGTVVAWLIGSLIRDMQGAEIRSFISKSLTWQVEYEELGLALTGSIALYFLGTVEPVIGSSKLASLLVMTAGVSFILFLPGMVFTLYDNKVWHQKLVPSSGPLPGIFALYVVYWLVIPIHRPYAFGMLGISFSEKAPIYLLGVQLFFSGGWNSIFPSIAGILCGAAWVSDVHGMQHVRIPLLKSLVNCLAVFVSKVRGSPIPALSEWGETRISNTQNNLQVPIQDRVVVPTEESMRNLMSMGFDRAVASEALLRSNDNLQRAITSLLDQ